VDNIFNCGRVEVINNGMLKLNGASVVCRLCRGGMFVVTKLS
jgi:hypothetical protein